MEIYFAESPGGRFNELNVFFGEREVLWRRPANQGIECIECGHWPDLVFELNEYEMEFGDWMVDGPYKVSHTLVDICRREARENRIIMKQLRKKCFDVLCKYGNVSGEDNYVERCEVVFDDGGNMCKFKLKINDCGRSLLSVCWNKKTVFSYDWIGGMDMDKNGRGKYYYGEWERTLSKI